MHSSADVHAFICKYMKINQYIIQCKMFKCLDLAIWLSASCAAGEMQVTQLWVPRFDTII